MRSLALIATVVTLVVAGAVAQTCDPSTLNFDRDMSARALLYSIAAYYPDNVAGTANSAPFTGPWCDLLSQASSGPASSFPVSYGPQSAVAIFGGMAEDDSLVISVRGTASNLKNWVADLKADKSLCLDFPGEVHDGFCGAYRELRGAIADIFSNAKGSTIRRVIVTGHSLGAAVATLVAMEMTQSYPSYDSGYPSYSPDPWFLRSGSPDLYLITFGSPRVGNHVFASGTYSALQNKGWNTYRFVNGNDVVPGVPPRLLSSGYTHIGLGMHLVKSGLTSDPDRCCSADVTVQEHCLGWSDSVGDHSSVNSYWPHFKSSWPPYNPSWLTEEHSSNSIVSRDNQDDRRVLIIVVASASSVLVAVALVALSITMYRRRRSDTLAKASTEMTSLETEEA